MARILIVDDEPLVRSMLRQVLERAGYDVTEAGNGEEAIKLYRDRPADVIVIDIIMPDKEGIETIRELRRDDPDVKTIAISGGGRGGALDYLAMAAKLGANHTLPKPVERQELLDAIRDCLST